MTVAIATGSRVTLHYSLYLGDGTLVETTAEREPLTVVIGSGELPEFLESRLLGMQGGQHAIVEFTAAETQALASGQAPQRLPRTDFPANLGLEVGQLISFALPEGQEIPGVVLELTEKEVVVDFDHPLAGRDLLYEVEIVSIDGR